MSTWDTARRDTQPGRDPRKGFSSSHWGRRAVQRIQRDRLGGIRQMAFLNDYSPPLNAFLAFA